MNNKSILIIFIISIYICFSFNDKNNLKQNKISCFSFNNNTLYSYSYNIEEINYICQFGFNCTLQSDGTNINLCDLLNIKVLSLFMKVSIVILTSIVTIIFMINILILLTIIKKQSFLITTQDIYDFCYFN